MNPIINPQEIAAARETALTDMETTVKTLSRRAAAPADKVAFAEIQQEVLEMRERWVARGLLPATAATSTEPLKKSA